MALDVPFASTMNAVFMVQPTLAAARLVARSIKAHQLECDPEPSYHVLFTPQRSFIADRVLEEEGVREDLDSLDSCEVDLIPLDDDLLSMHCPTGFADCFLHQDHTLVSRVSRALHRMQLLYGMAQHVHACGDLSCAVAQSLLEAKNSVVDAGGADGVAYPASGTLSDIVILDRTADLVTPLLSPLSFEALVHDTLTLASGTLMLHPKHLAADPDKRRAADAEVEPPPDAPPVRIALNASDQMYATVRSMHVAVVPEFLKAQAKELNEWYEARHTLDATDDISAFVKNIPGKQQHVRGIAQMINLAGLVQDVSTSPAFSEQWQMERAMLDQDNERGVAEFLADAMARQRDATSTLRLLCLHSQCCGGLKKAALDALRKEFLDAYGFEHVLTLSQLEACGLLRARGHDSGAFAAFGSGGVVWPWPAIRDDLGLVAGEVDVHRPTTPHYLTSGYAPLSVQMINVALTRGFAAVKHVKAPTLALRQAPKEQSLGDAQVQLGGGAGAGSAPAAATAAALGGEGGGVSRFEGGSTRRRTVVVCFLGGVSYLEVAALRFLAEQHPIDFVVVADHITSGSALVDSVSMPLVRRTGFLASLEHRASGGGQLLDGGGAAP